MEIEKNIARGVSLASLSTYQIGGAAEFFIAVKTVEELQAAVSWAQVQKQPITILGGGSNILINDNGVAGLVIKLANDNLEIKGESVTSGASTTVREVAEAALTHGLTGIEWSIGIPGSMGGAIRGNAGAHGGSFDQVVTEVTVFDTKALDFKTFAPTDCHFLYRHSRFKDTEQYVIWEIRLMLRPGEEAVMTEQMEEYRAYRRTSQPQAPSAGCVFKNLLVSEIEASNPEVVAMAEADHKIRGGKIGAGYLIEKLGLMGYRIGKAEISPQHANFVVNLGQAQAQEVREIMKHVQKQVSTHYHIDLEPEIQLVGF